MKIAIDMTWLKPKKSGGVESYIRNLFDGFKKIKNDNTYYLMTAKDNENEFDDYFKDPRFIQIKCNTKANDVKSHLIWQTLKQYKMLKGYDVDLVFFPVYEMPLYKSRKYKTVVVIHDIQAYHYPEFFSKFENMWFKMAWKKCIKNSNIVLTTTEFNKKDMKENILNKDNIEVINIPITVNKKKLNTGILKKLSLKENEYYYTVSSLYKHKNLKTLIEMIKKIKDSKIKIPKKLVISGVSAGHKEEFYKLIEGMEENIILTGFVSNDERDELIQKCNCFLHPSIFEGFGMTPVEAKMLGAKVITTKETALPESTRNKCIYVDDPFNIDEWIEKIKSVQNKDVKPYDYPEYEPVKIAKKYLDLFEKIK